MKLFNETQWTPEAQNQILQELKNWLQQVRSGELTVDEQFLDQLASRQDAHGFWGLGVTEDMPRDVRFDAITLPTAMLSAGLMEQAMRHGSSAQLERLLKPALQFLGDHGFQGHGYDRVRGYLQVLQILKSESVEVFVRQHGDMSPAIHQRMLDAPIQLSQIVQTNNDDWLIGEDERNLAQELIQPILQPDEKLYFAYGSNMDVAQMETRCPSARFIGLAIVEDYTLNYRKSCSGYFATLDQQENQVTQVSCGRLIQMMKPNLITMKESIRVAIIRQKFERT